MISFQGSDQATRQNRGILTDGDKMAAAIVKISTAAYVISVDFRRFVCFPLARDRALDLLPFRAEI